MSAEYKKEKMESLFRNIFPELSGASTEKIESAVREEIETWDSANHLLLITCLEQDFQITISDEQAVGIDSFRYAMALVQ